MFSLFFSGPPDPPKNCTLTNQTHDGLQVIVLVTRSSVFSTKIDYCSEKVTKFSALCRKNSQLGRVRAGVQLGTEAGIPHGSLHSPGTQTARQSHRQKPQNVRQGSSAGK